MATIINASIELTKIDKTKIFEKDGRKYLSITISVNDTTNYGNNVGISINQTKEEREAKAPKTFIGNGKVSWTDGNIQVAEKENAPTQQAPISKEVDDDLPF